MHKLRLSALLALLALLALGAAPAAAAPAGQGTLPPAMVGPEWSLVTLQPSGEAAEDVTGGGITLTFGPEAGRAGGSGGCNTYFTGYTAGADGALTFESPGATLRACEDPANRRETAYFQALAAVTSYTLDGTTLTLKSGDSGQLVFTTGAAGGGTGPATLPSTGAPEGAALLLLLAAAGLAGAGLALRRRAA